MLEFDGVQEGGELFMMEKLPYISNRLTRMRFGSAKSNILGFCLCILFVIFFMVKFNVKLHIQQLRDAADNGLDQRNIFQETSEPEHMDIQQKDTQQQLDFSDNTPNREFHQLLQKYARRQHLKTGIRV